MPPAIPNSTPEGLRQSSPARESRGDRANAAPPGSAKAIRHNFEKETRVPHDRTLADIRRALEEAGVEMEFDGAAGIGIRVARSL